MRILKLINDKKQHQVEVDSILSMIEFSQLRSELDSLCVFSKNCIEEPARVIKTGARHSHTKYILLPKSLRRKFKNAEFDFDHLKVGHIKVNGDLFLIYEVPGKGVGKVKNKN